MRRGNPLPPSVFDGNSRRSYTCSPPHLDFSTRMRDNASSTSISLNINTRASLLHHIHLDFGARRRNDGPSTSIPLDIDTRKRDHPSSTISTSIPLPGGGPSTQLLSISTLGERKIPPHRPPPPSPSLHHSFPRAGSQ